MQISKSDYMLFLRQPAWLWVEKNDPGKIPPIDEATQATLDAGHAFEPYVESQFAGGVTLGFVDADESRRYHGAPSKHLQAARKCCSSRDLNGTNLPACLTLCG